MFHNGSVFLVEGFGDGFVVGFCETSGSYYRFDGRKTSDKFGDHVHWDYLESRACLTIHKCQGQTIEKGIIIIDTVEEPVSSFYYVALSRFQTSTDVSFYYMAHLKTKRRLLLRDNHVQRQMCSMVHVPRDLSPLLAQKMVQEGKKLLHSHGLIYPLGLLDVQSVCKHYGSGVVDAPKRYKTGGKRQLFMIEVL